MPILDPKAIKSVMMRHNYIFKHQVANLVGISYEHLARILVDDETEVEEEIVKRFCAGLDCERSEIVIES